MACGRRLFVLLAASVVFASGCLSSTLPLPPPEPNVSAPDENGDARLTGTVPPQALAEAINNRTGDIAGQVTDETGAYDFTIRAVVGDELTFYYVKGGEQSVWVSVTVPAQ